MKKKHVGWAVCQALSHLGAVRRTYTPAAVYTDRPSSASTSSCRRSARHTRSCRCLPMRRAESSRRAGCHLNRIDFTCILVWGSGRGGGCDNIRNCWLLCYNPQSPRPGDILRVAACAHNFLKSAVNLGSSYVLVSLTEPYNARKKTLLRVCKSSCKLASTQLLTRKLTGCQVTWCSQLGSDQTFPFFLLQPFPSFKPRQIRGARLASKTES